MGAVDREPLENWFAETVYVSPPSDLDAVGALVRKHARGHRAGEQRAEVDDDDAAHRAWEKQVLSAGGSSG